MKYSIHHSISGMNYLCKENEFPYQKMCDLESPDIDTAFFLSQNDYNEYYNKLGIRSTSVGDIISYYNDEKEYVCKMVLNRGFKVVSEDNLILENV